MPPLLPQIEHISGTAQLQDETGVEGLNHVHRLREVTVSSMVETLAARRLSLINQAGPSPLPAELLSLCPGDQVEIHRATTKDRPAWVGPATVKATDQEHGKITVQWQGRNIDVPLEGVRRAMIFATFYFDDTLQSFPMRSHGSIQLVRRAMEHIETRSVLLGWNTGGCLPKKPRPITMCKLPCCTSLRT